MCFYFNLAWPMLNYPPLKNLEGKELAMRANLKVLRDFYSYSAPQLVTFGSNVAANLDPTKFPNLPVTPTALKGLADDLNTKQAATITGGTPETAARNKAFDTLSAALDSNADIVELVAKDDMEMLLATGYLPASTSRTSSPLSDTSIVSLMNNGTTQVLLRLEPVVNAKTYQVQTSTDGGKAWVDACISSQARRIVLTGLTPGTTYAVRARAIGGSTGASNWTASSSIMST
jgi:hypothetical protein